MKLRYILAKFRNIRSIYHIKLTNQKPKDDQQEVLVKPEFEGLWNKELKAYNVNDLYKVNFKFPPTFKTKAEKVKRVV